MAITLNGTTGIAGVDGSAGTPAVQGGDSNTGIFFPAADTIAFAEGGAEVARFDSSGNVLVGKTTSSAGCRFELERTDNDNGLAEFKTNNASGDVLIRSSGGYVRLRATGTNEMAFLSAGTEHARIDSAGTVLVGKTTSNLATAGVELYQDGTIYNTVSASTPLVINRLADDGTLISFRQAGTQEGRILVAGTSVTLEGAHLSRPAQFTDNSRPDILKGTVMSNLDQMSHWENEDNEQLNCVKVSDIEGDPNVAGVFLTWDEDQQVYNDIVLSMTGDMVIRIGAGVTVQRGDLLMSAGDGTAKPQGDDIVRSKTIAKVTSTHVSHTYADGSYAVPCVLMAC